MTKTILTVLFACLATVATAETWTIQQVNLYAPNQYNNAEINITYKRSATGTGGTFYLLFLDASDNTIGSSIYEYSTSYNSYITIQYAAYSNNSNRSFYISKDKAASVKKVVFSSTASYNASNVLEHKDIDYPSTDISQTTTQDEDGEYMLNVVLNEAEGHSYTLKYGFSAGMEGMFLPVEGNSSDGKTTYSIPYEDNSQVLFTIEDNDGTTTKTLYGKGKSTYIKWEASTYSQGEFSLQKNGNITIENCEFSLMHNGKEINIFNPTSKYYGCKLFYGIQEYEEYLPVVTRQKELTADDFDAERKVFNISRIENLVRDSYSYEYPSYGIGIILKREDTLIPDYSSNPYTADFFAVGELAELPVNLISNSGKDSNDRGDYSADGLPMIWAKASVKSGYEIDNITMQYALVDYNDYRDMTDNSSQLTGYTYTKGGTVYDFYATPEEDNYNDLGVRTFEVQAFNSDGSFLGSARVSNPPYTVGIDIESSSFNIGDTNTYNVSFNRCGVPLVIDGTNVIAKYRFGEAGEVHDIENGISQKSIVDNDNNGMITVNLYTYMRNEYDEVTQNKYEKKAWSQSYYSTSEFGYPNYLGQTADGTAASATFVRASDDLTDRLSATWNGLSSTTTGPDWTGNSRKYYVVPASTTVSQTVNGLSEGHTYTVQAIVRTAENSTVKLKLNGEEATIKGIDNSTSMVNPYGRVDVLFVKGQGLSESRVLNLNNRPKSGGWMKVEKTVTMTSAGSLDISLEGEGEFYLSDVTLLEDANTSGHFITTIDDISNDAVGVYNDLDIAKVKLGNVRKVSFFDRGPNPNRIVLFNSVDESSPYSKVLAVDADHLHPFNVASYKMERVTEIGTYVHYSIPLLYITDNTTDFEQTAFLCPPAVDDEYHTAYIYAENVSYDRSFKAGQKSTLALPVQIPASRIWNACYGTDINCFDDVLKSTGETEDEFQDYRCGYFAGMKEGMSGVSFNVIRRHDAENYFDENYFVGNSNFCADHSETGDWGSGYGMEGFMTGQDMFDYYNRGSQLVPFYMKVKDAGMPLLNMHFPNDITTLMYVKQYHSGNEYDESTYGLWNYMGNTYNGMQTYSHSRGSTSADMMGTFFTTQLSYDKLGTEGYGKLEDESDVNGGVYYYFFSGNNFYRIDDGVTVNLKPFRAFIIIPKSYVPSNARQLSICFGDTSDEATAIAETATTENMQNPLLDTTVYDIQGRRVASSLRAAKASGSLPKGIYIVGGKKIVIK